MRSAKVSSHRRAGGSIAAVALTLVCVAVPGAHGQEPGVIYEPGSPSDKEYAIPLEEIRRDAGGEQSNKIEALPFGIGLSRNGGGDSGGRAGGGSGQAGGGEDQARSGVGAAREGRDLRERLADAEDAGAPALWRLAPLLLVLLPALLVALLLARRDRQQPAT